MAWDLRRAKLTQTEWVAYDNGELFPWAAPTGGGGADDPTANAGSVPVGNAAYAIPSTGVIYVASSTGSDSNDGTQSAPKATFAGAVAAAATSGTTIVMRGGVYNDGGDTQTTNTRNPGIFVAKQFTVQNYPGEAVWFDGSVPFTGAWTPSGGMWAHPYTMRFDRSHGTGSGQADVDSGNAATGGTYVDNALNPVAANPDMILLDGVQLTQVANQADVGPGKFWVEGSYLTNPNSLWFQATKVWIGDDPAGHEVRYANRTSLLQTRAAGCVFRGFGIRRYATHQTGFGAMWIDQNNTLLENLWFEDMSASACWTQNSGTGIIYRNITARRIGFQFTGGSGDNLLFDLCDFQQINYRNFNPKGPSLGIIKIQASQKVVVQNSIFANSNCDGFWTDRTVDRPWVVNSRFQNLGQHGIDFEGASYYIAANCLITNCGGISIWNNDSDQGQVWNCTLVDSHRVLTGGSPFQVGQSTRRSWDPSYAWMKDTRQPASYWDDPAHQWQCNAFTLKNNVIVQNDPSKSQGVFSCQSQADKSSTGNRPFTAFGPDMDSNVYWYQTKPQYPFIATRGNTQGPLIYPTNASGNGLLQFGAAYGQEANGTLAGTRPTDSSFRLLDAAYHTKATPLPDDIAALIGQPAGTKHAGTFLVGSA